MRKARAALLSLLVVAAACSDPSNSTGPTSGGQSPELALASGTGDWLAISTALPSLLCIDAGGSTRLTLRACREGAGYQKFLLQDNGEIRHGNSCVGAWGGKGNDGDPATVYKCNGRAEQKWSTTPAGEIRGINGKCMDVKGGLGNVGDAVVIMPCTGGKSQQWNNIPGDSPSSTDTTSVSADTTGVAADSTDAASDSPAIHAGEWLPIRTALESALCMDAGASTRLTLNACREGAGYQKFLLQDNGEIRHGNSCVGAWGGKGNDGDPATVYKCNGGAEQQWSATQGGEIRGINGKCMDVKGGLGKTGDAVVIMPCTGGKSQWWSNTDSDSPSPSEPVAAVKLNPTSATLAVGEAAELTAAATDAAGNVLVGRTVSWSSSNSMVASVSASGLVTANAAGTAVISATSEGKSASATIVVSASVSTPPDGMRSGYYVSPTGTSGGDGSVAKPWSLSAALAQPQILQAGDTIWLRGGTYRGTMTSRLTGTPGRLIVLRQYPGERATIDGTLNVTGAYAAYWGFEFTNSDLAAYVGGIEVTGPGNKFINLIVHDASANGFGVWEGASDAELYGNIVYNNGRGGSSPGRWAHGIYFHNRNGGKRLVDNVVFNSYSYNFHGYTTNGGLNDLYLEGNVSFNAGSFVTYGGAEYLIGGKQLIRNLTFTNNFSYRGGELDARNEFGYSDDGASPVGSRITNNYLTGMTKIRYFDGLTFTGNTLVNARREMVELFFTGGQSLTSGYVWNDNTYRAPNTSVALFRRMTSPVTPWSFASWQREFGHDRSSDYQGASASDTRVFVRPNQYETGRGHVVVYNWSRQGSVSADLSGMLRAGDRFEIRNVQNYFGSPVVSGTYSGGSVSLPMAEVTAVRPRGAIENPAPSTGTEFHTFVVMKI